MSEVNRTLIEAMRQSRNAIKALRDLKAMMNDAAPPPSSGN